MTESRNQAPAGSLASVPSPEPPAGSPADLDADAEAALELEKRLQYLANRPDLEAAQAEVLEARAGLAEETERLEASARAALDIPGRVRREPAKVAGVAAGTAFLVVGGPARVYRRVRRAVLGPRAELPKSMLPREIEKELRKLGDDGNRVRAVLEREFVHYLDEKADVRRERDLGATLSWLAANLLRVASLQAGRRLIERLFESDRPGYDEALRRARERGADARRRNEDAGQR